MSQSENPRHRTGRHTLPAIVADAQLFSGEVTVPVIGAAAVGFTVGDVTGFALPVFITFTVHLTWNGDTSCTLPVTRAIVRTGIDSVKHSSS